MQHWPDSVKHCNEHDTIPFHYAATRSSPDYVSVLRFLAQQWPEAVQSKSMGGAIGGLPLMRALGNRNVPMEIIAYLIELWPDPMKEVRDGQTMLCHAVRYHYRNNDVISLLIDQWPEAIRIPNSDGNLPLTVALTLEEEEEKPSVELIPMLTNGMPPLHFLCQYSNSWTTQRMDAIKYLASIFPEDGMQFDDGMLPFHWDCRSRAPQSVLEWWCQQYPTIISTRTIHTHELPLHCYLSSSSTTTTGTGTTTTTDQEAASQNQDPMEQHGDDLDSDSDFLLAVQFLVEKYPDAVTCTDRMGWLPFQVAALHNAALDVVFFLIGQHPGALQR